MNRADSAADVEERVAVAHVRPQLLDQAARVHERAPPMHALEFLLRVITIELVLECFTCTA